MPDLTPYAKIPIPSQPEMDDVPAVLGSLVDAFENMLVIKVADEIERDDLPTGLPVGSIATGTAVNKIWRKLVDGSWKLIYGYTPLANFDPAYSPGFSMSVQPQWAMNGTSVQVSGAVAYSGATITPVSTGNFADVPMCTLPSYLRPRATQELLISFGSLYICGKISTAGLITLTFAINGNGFGDGAIFNLGLDYTVDA